MPVALTAEQAVVTIQGGAKMFIGSRSMFMKSQVHHIASNKGAWANEFKPFFDKAGMSLDDAANKMNLPGHVGRHTNKYHQLVFDRLEEALTGKTGQAAKDALKKALAKLRKALEENPRLPYKDGGL